jgi:hypothetical protein
MKPITVVVGDKKKVATFGQRYYSNAEEVLKDCRKYGARLSEIRTNNHSVVHGFQVLHKLREFNVTLRKDDIDYELDMEGDLIRPWPDQFFEVDFYLVFHHEGRKAE